MIHGTTLEWTRCALDLSSYWSASIYISIVLCLDYLLLLFCWMILLFFVKLHYDLLLPWIIRQLLALLGILCLTSLQVGYRWFISGIIYLSFDLIWYFWKILYFAEQRQHMRTISRGERPKDYQERSGQKRKYQSSENQSVQAAAKEFLEKAAREILGNNTGGIKGPITIDISDDDDE